LALNKYFLNEWMSEWICITLPQRVQRKDIGPLRAEERKK
jgi:hypothetical protein